MWVAREITRCSREGYRYAGKSNDCYNRRRGEAIASPLWYWSKIKFSGSSKIILYYLDIFNSMFPDIFQVLLQSLIDWHLKRVVVGCDTDR